MLDVPCYASKSYLIEKGKELFFSEGASYHGSEEEMTFDLVNFKGDIIDDTNNDFTVQKYFEQHRLTKLSVYLASVSCKSNRIKDKGRTWRENLNTSIKRSDAEMYQDIEDSDDYDDTLLGNSDE